MFKEDSSISHPESVFNEGNNDDDNNNNNNVIILLIGAVLIRSRIYLQRSCPSDYIRHIHH